MPKVAKELSAIEVRRLVHPGKGGVNATFPVGGVSGLILQITQGGGRSWLLRTTVGDQRRHIGLGSYPEVSLAEARERARLTKAKIAQGVDPILERQQIKAALKAQQARGKTFRQAVADYLTAKAAEFDEKRRKRWESGFDRLAFPIIGDTQVEAITMQDVLRVLSPIWETKNETASRLRQRIEAVLTWATVSGHRAGDNPARWVGNLKELLPAPSKVSKVENQPAVALKDVRAWWADLRQRGGTAARALEFAVLTAARSGEVRGAVWSEIDLDAGLWTIPAARMKMEREHRVALTPEAVALLKALPRFEGNDLVFVAPLGGMLSDMSISAVMRRMQKDAVEAGGVGYLDPRSGRPAVPHGLRSTFKDWATDLTDYPNDMSEVALSHKVGSSVESAYRRGDMIEKRRAMMADWAFFLKQSH